MSWEVLTPVMAWLGNTSFALWIGAATWRVAWLLSIHLFGLTLLLGSVLILSLHLLGLFQPQKSPRRLRQDVQVALRLGLILALGTGALIFTGGAEAYWANYWLRLKLALLVVAVIFHLTAYRAVSMAPEGRFSRLTQQVTGACMVSIWFAVAWAGRAIAFF